MEIKNVKVEDLIPYENNPRNNEGAVEYVVNSIKEFGFKVPIVIDRNNTIVAGHTRYLAASALGMDEVPCIVADDLSEEQIRAFRLADNKTAEKAGWDFTKLAEELDSLSLDIDFTQFGFGEFELDVLKNGNDFEEEEFDDLVEESSKTDEDAPKKITISYETDEEEEWLRNILCVDKLKKSFTCFDLMNEQM